MQLLRIIKGVASEAIQDNLIKLATLKVWYHTNCKNKQVLKPPITETSYTLNTNPQETDTPWFYPMELIVMNVSSQL
jgi:hypothetical protein